jgi:hypothetical protein
MPHYRYGTLAVDRNLMSVFGNFGIVELNPVCNRIIQTQN